jgi:hypothetical protein
MRTRPQGRRPRPAPAAPQREVTVRMPGELHARLCGQRELKGKSLNSLILVAIARALPLPIVGQNQTDESANQDQPK